jgi:hypothetical protein
MSIVPFMRRREVAIEPSVEQDFADELAASFAPASLLDKHSGALGRVIERLSNEGAELVAHIAERTERLRMVRVLHGTYSTAERTIEAGKMPMAAE